MNKLIQNNLAEATTEMGFPADVEFPLQREVTLDDGTTVIVEGVTPDKMKTILNQNIESEEVQNVTFKTPGENYVENDVTLIKGVCQVWNESIVEPDLVSIAVTTPPTKTTYTAGETLDLTGMVITATYSNETEKVITDYETTPNLETELTTTDTEITITYEEKTATQAITVTE